MQVRIYQPAKSAMQSADEQPYWQLDFVRKPNHRFKESLMGRNSSYDMSNEVKIRFNSKEEAINFAKKNSYEYELIQPKKAKIPKKSYAGNFR